MSLFGPDHERFRRRVRGFVAEHLTPYADAWEQEQSVPRRVFRLLGEEGLLGLGQRRDVGGQELDFGYTVVLAEELPRSRMAGLTLSVLAQTNIALPVLARLGTPAQREAFLAPAIRGEMIGAFAVTEPTGGSDITRAVQCTAVDDGDHWVVTGEKKYITNGPIADFVVTLVRTRPEPTANALTLLVIPTSTPGFAVKETFRKLGMHTSPTGWLTFDHCRVPKGNTVGRPNVGYHYAAMNLLEERLVGGVSAVAMARLVLEETIAHVQQRRAFDQRLADLQALRHRLVELAADVEMSQRFVYSVSESYRDGRVEAKEICMIKFRVYEIVQHVVTQCLQLFGAAGFMEDHWVARAYRDVRVLSLGGGTSELMKDLTAAYLRL